MDPITLTLALPYTFTIAYPLYITFIILASLYLGYLCVTTSVRLGQLIIRIAKLRQPIEPQPHTKLVNADPLNANCSTEGFDIKMAAQKLVAMRNSGYMPHFIYEDTMNIAHRAMHENPHLALDDMEKFCAKLREDGSWEHLAIRVSGAIDDLHGELMHFCKEDAALHPWPEVS